MRGEVPGAARLQLVHGARLLRPDEQVFTAMLDGWRNQQLARNLSFGTIESRERAVKAFTRSADAFPWVWTPQLVDEWMGDLRSVRDLKRSTLRNYQDALRSFCRYLTDPAYGWAAECEDRFGTHPIQVVHEWNSAVHVQEAEPTKRAFTPEEIQAFLDYTDDQVIAVRGRGRKGWMPAFRDDTLFKVAYGYGLRRRETRMLDPVDFGRNPEAPEFGDHGVCYIRYGKAKPGSSPKRRSVLTVWGWVVEAADQWETEVRPRFSTAAAGAYWPSERGPRVGYSQINTRFATYRDALGLNPALDFHSFRRSYVTHLIEEGWDARFVQEQVGHEHASTTAIYTCVSSDFRTRTLRRVLDATLEAALRPARSGSTR